MASGLTPAAAAARSVAEKLSIYSVHVSYCPIYLPSRPLPAELEAFLEAGVPPVSVGFGSMRAPTDIAAVALSAALRTALASETRIRAAAVAGTIRTDGATVAAKLLADAVSRQRPPASV